MDPRAGNTNVKSRLTTAATATLALFAAAFTLLMIYGVWRERLAHALVFLVLALLTCALFTRPIVMRTRLALLLIASVAALYLGEIVLAIANPALAAVPAWKAGRPYDFRSVTDVVRDLRSQKVDAYPRFNPRPFLSSRWLGELGDPTLKPLGAISNTTTVYCNEASGYMIYQTDEHGFHNPRGLWDGRAIDFMSVGDSHTLGGCVPPRENFVNLIRDRYPSMLNLGMGGNGPMLMLASLLEYASVVRPKVVLWFFYEGNDLQDLAEERINPLMQRYLTDQFVQNLVHRQPEIDFLLKALTEQRLRADSSVLLVRPTGFRYEGLESWRRLVFLADLRESAAALLEPEIGTVPTDELQQLDLFRTVLAKAKSTVAQWGGELRFVYLPGARLLSNASGRLTLRAGVIRATRELEIPVIDVYPSFHTQPDPISLFARHYNEAGHRLVAEKVLQSLTAEGRSN